MIFRKTLLSLALTIAAGSAQVWAAIPAPARLASQVTEAPAPQQTVQVSSARVVTADYELIRRDFPKLRQKTEAEIDGWLLANTAFMSVEQTQQLHTNFSIPQGTKTKTAMRPPDYQRALVFSVDGGLIDGKGFGAVDPKLGDHSDGLATLSEVLREFVYEKMVQKLFDHARSGLHTVGSYAVIDWGFRVKYADGGTTPAGAILRQAHRRAPGRVSLLDDDATKKIELLLRRYGVTSAGAHRDIPFDLLNIQGTDTGAVVDFGGFLTVKEFTRIGVPFYGYVPTLWPNTAEYIQPDPRLRVPLDLWGTGASGKEDPKFDNISIWSDHVAEALASGRADRRAVTAHFHNLLDPVEARLRAQPAKLRCEVLF
jgi:hypothetical protein